MKSRIVWVTSIALLATVGVAGWSASSVSTDGGSDGVLAQSDRGVLLDPPGTTDDDIVLFTESPTPSARVNGGIRAATAGTPARRGSRGTIVPPSSTTTIPGTPTTTPGTPTTTPGTPTTTTTPGTPTTTTPGTPTTTTAPPSTSFDLSLDRFYINQAVPALDTNMSPNDRIAPVARRDGLARAFVSANASSTVRPDVELHWRHPNGATGVVDLVAPVSTPTAPTEASLASTFNTRIGTNWLIPNTEIFVVVDPRNTIPEADETNNRWPASGWASAQVADVGVFEVTWVPIIVNGVQGNINAGNLAAFEDRTMRVMPIPGIDSEIHAPIVFNGDLSQPSGWSELLQQVAQLRNAEGSNRAYHGIVRRPSGTGIAGIGYRGFEAAVSMDALSAASDVVAHEFGHNFGLPHAPCGNAAGADQNFPYPDGRIGTWGYDIVSGGTYDPNSRVRDVMSYCDPSWISDYNYRLVLQNRLASPSRLPVFDGTALHVSGVIDEDVAEIAPAYSLEGGGVRAIPGRYTLVGADADGTELFKESFAAHEAEIHGGPHGHDEYFAFSIPITDAQLAQLHSLTVVVDGEPIGRRESSPRSGSGVAPSERRSTDDDTTTITWDPTVAVGVVRDATTGDVLAVSETGSAEIASTVTDVEVIVSDGVTSTSSASMSMSP